MIEEDIEYLEKRVDNLTEIVRNFIALQGDHDKDCLFLKVKHHLESRKVDSAYDREYGNEIQLYCFCKQKKVHSPKCHSYRTSEGYIRNIEDDYCLCGAAKIKQLLEG